MLIFLYAYMTEIISMKR